MEAVENIREVALPVHIGAETPSVDLKAISMRALRRKARRISAYARFNVEMLNALAVEVESDLAALRH